MDIQAAIFDLGGVLLRTEDRSPRTELARRFNMTFEEIEKLVFYSASGKLAAMGKISAHVHWEEVCKVLKIPFTQMAEIQRDFFGGDRVDRELITYIRSLRPRRRTAMLSNAWDDLRQWLEAEWKIADAFDEIIISAEIGLAKPDPRIYRLALERLEVDPANAVFVDDFQENVDGALALGIHGILFKTPYQVMADLSHLLDGTKHS